MDGRKAQIWARFRRFIQATHRHSAGQGVDSKRWSVVVVPYTSERAYSLSVSKDRLVQITVVAALLLVTGFAVIVGLFTRHELRSRARLRWVQAQSQVRIGELQEEVRRRDRQLGELRSEINALIEIEGKLRNLAGLKPRSMDEARVAGGQGSQRAANEGDGLSVLLSVSPPGGGPAISPQELLSVARERRKDFTELLEAFEERSSRLLYTPSICPVDSQDAWFSSGFGNRHDPVDGEWRFHSGLDVVAPRYTPVLATAKGKVTFAGWKTGLGRCVIIKHRYGYETLYAHSERLLVEKGDIVKRGDAIAEIGSSGRTTGPHLHYEVLLYGKAVNPYKYLF